MTLPTVTRLGTIVYGSLTMGGATAYQLHDVHAFDSSYEEAAVSWVVVITDPNEATLETLAKALEAELSLPNLDLRVSIGTTPIDWIELNHSDNTGFNARPNFQLLGTHRSANSRAYRCSVRVLKPATEPGKDGRQSESVIVSTDDSGRLTLQIEATYTALPPATSASAAVAAGFPAFVTAQQALFPGIEWDDTEAQTLRRTAEDKIATVSARYFEIKQFEQSSGTLDDPEIVADTWNVAVFREGPGDLTGSAAGRFVSVVVDVSCNVPFSQITDPEVDLVQIYEAKLRPYAREVARSQTSAGALAILNENPAFDMRNSRIVARITFVGTETNLISSSLVIGETSSLGKFLVPVLDGDSDSRDLHRVPTRRRRVITLETREVEAQGTQVGGDVFEEAVRASEEAGFLLLDDDIPVYQREEIGIAADGSLIAIVHRRRTAFLEFAKIRRGAGVTADSRPSTRAGGSNFEFNPRS